MRLFSCFYSPPIQPHDSNNEILGRRWSMRLDGLNLFWEEEYQSQRNNEWYQCIDYYGAGFEFNKEKRPDSSGYYCELYDSVFHNAVWIGPFYITWSK